jgi:hypothetical protein
LFTLGEPDEVASDDSQFIYSSAYKKGGVGSVYLYVVLRVADVQREQVQYRRLVIEFDHKGIVDEIRVDERSCGRWFVWGGPGHGQSATTPACMEMHADDLTASGNARGAMASRYRVLWHAGVTNASGLARGGPGFVEVGTEALVFREDGSSSSVKISFADVSSISVLHWGLFGTLVAVKTKDAGGVSFGSMELLREGSINHAIAASVSRDLQSINLKTEPLLDPLRKEPRFQAIGRKLGFPD